MDEVREAAESFLEAHPDREDQLRLLLEYEQEQPWQFDEIPLDSGEFGEIVSYDLVTETSDGYVVADADAIRIALGDTEQTQPSKEEEDEGNRLGKDLTAAWKQLHQARLSVLAVVGTLVLAAVLRVVFAYDAVFRKEGVVLSGNDPYLTYYWVDHLHQEAFGLTDPRTWATFPAGLWDHDLLGVFLLWVVSAVAGGPEAVGFVMAWYPVVVGILVGIVVYATAMQLSADRRVGVTALLFYAITPAVVNRTSVGFADTEPFDYLWLMLTVLALVVLASTDDDSLVPSNWRRRLAIVALGTGIAAQILTWRGGPLLLLPLGIVLVGMIFSAYRADQNLTKPTVDILAGLALASVITLGSHIAFGWLQSYRAIVPVLLLGGGAATLGLVTAAERRSVSVERTALAFVAVSLVSFVALWIVFPPLSEGVLEFADYMQEFTWGPITETQSIFSADRGTWLGPFFYLGLGFIFALGALLGTAWLVVTRHAPAWLTAGVYGWYFLILSVVQLRFAGYFGLVTAVLAGIGFVRFLSALELASPIELRPAQEKATGEYRPLSLPSRKVATYTAGILFVVVGFSVLLLPGFHADITQDGEDYQTAKFVEEYSADRDIAYPGNYVFTDWGTNRMYNYVVSGHSHSYHFARHNYPEFLGSTDPGRWYERLSERTGFVVTEDQNQEEEIPVQTMQRRLHDHYGSATNETEAVSHYRAIYVSEDGSRKVFALVPGATVEGALEANESIRVSTTVTLPPADTEVTYEQRVAADDQGQFAFTTPYPGTYEIDNREVTVDEEAIETGERIRLDDEAADDQ